MSTPTAGQCRPMLLLNAQYLPGSRDWRTTGSLDSPYSADTFIREARMAETAGIDAFFQADLFATAGIRCFAERQVGSITGAIAHQFQRH